MNQSVKQLRQPRYKSMKTPNQAKLLVTGGAGFIGSHIVDHLIARGYEVIVLDNLATGRRENVNPKANFFEADIADYERIVPYFRGIDAVFHTAALARIQPAILNPLTANEANITGTLNVLWAAKNHGVKKVIYSGSSSVYGNQAPAAYPLHEDQPPNPGSPYAVQKVVGEMYCRLFDKLYNLPTVILRYFNVYGPRQITEGAYATVIGIFLRQRQNGEAMTIVGDGEQQRDYTHISDVVAANLLAWQSPVRAGEIFNIGFGKDYSVNEVARLIGGASVYIPPRPGEYRLTLADNAKAARLLGWKPSKGLAAGIAELKALHGL